MQAWLNLDALKKCFEKSDTWLWFLVVWLHSQIGFHSVLAPGSPGLTASWFSRHY